MSEEFSLGEWPAYYPKARAKHSLIYAPRTSHHVGHHTLHSNAPKSKKTCYMRIMRKCGFVGRDRLGFSAEKVHGASHRVTMGELYGWGRQERLGVNSSLYANLLSRV
ncbi:hypothetical protein AX14_007780 [Amanita brunnescens Koide BX004]|nr:hypothetical protein AX14_007780 [Amanita brunnescens Koide BX004]